MKKLNLGEGGIQGLLAKHVEKIIFGVCVVLVVIFILSGLRLKSYDGEPSAMDQLAKQARENIDRDTWQNVESDQERITLTDYQAAVQAGNARTEAGAYPYRKTLQPLMQPPRLKREDPKILMPDELLVYSVNATIAVKDGGLDKLAELETKKVEPPKERKPDRREEQRARGSGGGGMRSSSGGGGMRSSSGGGGGGMRSSSGGGGMRSSGIPGGAGTMQAPGGEGSESGEAPELPKIFRNPEGWRPPGFEVASGGSGLAGLSGGGMSSGGMSSGGMRSSGGMSSGGMRSSGGMSSGGMRSSGGGAGAGSMMPQAGGSGTDTLQPEDISYESAHFVVIVANIPYEKQVDEFKNTFADAIGYDPNRDFPRYVAFRVERAEVSGDPNAILEWVNVGGTNSALKLARDKFGGQVPEVANALYTDPALTMPIPPVVMKDIKPFVNHPSIPSATDQLPSSMTEMTSTAATTEEAAEGDGDIPSDIPSGTLLNQGAGGMSSATGSGAGGSSGMMSSGGMRSSGGMSSGAMSSGGMRSSGGMMSSMGSGGPGTMAGGSMMANAAVAEYKLLRFFDFTAEPGKVYRYRVQLYVEDPNHPRLDESRQYADVQAQMLSEAVAARLAKLDDSGPGKKRIYYRLSDWSVETTPISLPPAESFYAGKPERVKLSVHKNGAQVHREPLEAKFTGVFFDDEYGVDISATLESIVGTVLDHKGETEVVHPLTLEFKVLKDYHLKSRAVIADIRGGETVGGKSNEPLHSPIEAAIVDAQGNLVVRNEIDDLDEYRRHAYVENEPDPSAMPMGGSSAGGLSSPGMGSGGMMSSPGGSGGARRSSGGGMRSGP